ncbi:carboxymuconolactone decarboxylase family protein [bacterium]|nr:carboxymuconolactone decarboxylase family protein [bacterium]
MGVQMNLPKTYTEFCKTYPEIAAAYRKMGEKIHEHGPLDERSRALVKLGLAMGARLEGGVHSQTRKALEIGLTDEEIRQVALLGIPTLGFPASMANMTWVEDILDK